MSNPDLGNYLTKAGLSDQDQVELIACLKPQELKAGDFWVRQGDVVENVSFVRKGLFKKSIVTPDGAVVVKGFAGEGEHLAPYSSLLTQKPAAFSIQALEESLILELPFKDLLRLYSSNNRFLKLGRAVAEEHFIESEKREFELLILKPLQILEQFKQDYPNLISRIPIKDLAAYLGIHPASLSRIRNRVSKNRNRN